MTQGIFLLLLGLASAWGLKRAWRARLDSAHEEAGAGADPGRDPVGIVIQTPLFLLSAWLAWRGGALSPHLLSPVPWMAGLAAGHVIFAGSLAITHGRLADVASVFFGVGRLIRFATARADLTLRTVAVAFTEEVIFREAAQRSVLTPLAGTIPAVVIAALCFMAVHEHLFQNTPRGLLEFAGFALLLGVLYHATDSLAWVTAVHAARNMESHWLETGCDAPTARHEGVACDRAEHPMEATHGFG